MDDFRVRNIGPLPANIDISIFLTHFVLWIDGHPEGVDAQRHLGDVDPLAVDVVVVDVLAA